MILPAICFVPMVITIATMWAATILLYRRGYKGLGVGMGVISGLLSLTVLCLGFAVILAGIPGIQPDAYPTPVLEFLPS